MSFQVCCTKRTSFTHTYITLTALLVAIAADFQSEKTWQLSWKCCQIYNQLLTTKNMFKMENAPFYIYNALFRLTSPGGLNL